MKARFLGFLAVLIALVHPAAAETKGDIIVVPFEGQVSEAQFIFLRRALKEAEAEGAAAIILDMDTPGGGLTTAVKMMDALFATSVPTITYVNQNAGSAGALISLSTRKIYMAPVSAIGAAAPVLSTGQEIPETMNDKMVSYYSKYFRSAAEKYGHNADVAEAFMNKDREIKVGDRILSKEGSVLSLSAQEAVMMVDGKPLLAVGIASSVEEIARMEGLSGEIKRVEPMGFERLAFWLTTLAPLFLVGGIIGTYIEFKSPGFGAPGIVAALCFIVFFTGHMLAGLAGYEVVGFFVLGLLFVLIELVFFPGVVIFAAAGTLLMLGALIYTMVDRYPNQPWVPSVDMLMTPMMNLLIAGVLGVILIAVLARFLPRTKFFSSLVLASANAPGAAISGAVAEIWKDREGVARTDLHPTGSIEIDGRIFDVVTEGGYVAKGQRVRVIARDGMRMVVEAAG